jgi:hypothetical protein
MKREKSITYMPKLLTGKVVVFTGKLTMPRAEATAMAERSGATVTSTVTKATNVVVVGADTGSKLDKALAKGIEVWTEDEFIRRMTVEDHQERLGENKGRVIAQTGEAGYQFSLAWDAFVDLDIHLATPKGELFYANKTLAGAELDVDRIPNRPEEEKVKGVWNVRPVENIVCDRAIPGEYHCWVIYFSNSRDWDTGKLMHKGPVPYTVHCRVGKEEHLHRASFSREDEEQTICRFTVGAGGKVTEVKFGGGAASPKAAEKAAKKAPVAVAAKKVAPAKKATKKAAKKAAPTTKGRVKTTPAARPPKKPAAKRAAAPKKKTAVPAKKAAKKAPAKKAAKKK